MNKAFLRRARISVIIGGAAILVGLTASACDSSAPTAAATATTVPATSTTASPQTGTPANAAGATTTRPPQTSNPAPKPVPVLGTVWGPHQQGYGTARPVEIYNGGDPTGIVSGVHWQSWGGAVAIGTGTAADARNTAVADAPMHKATVRAFNLGVCKGKLMYQAIEWYFPGEGDQFDPQHYINICTGEYVGQP